MKFYFTIFMYFFIFTIPVFDHDSFLIAQETPQDRSEVIKFSHEFHTEEAGAECLDCHVNVESSTVASNNLLPTMEECASCHDVEDNEECATCHYKGNEIPFENPNRSLIFSHERHVVTEKLTCIQCHVGVELVDYTGIEQMPEMSTCVICHDDRGASGECEACHVSTSLLGLRPTDHSSDWKFAHPEYARMDDSSCSTCHEVDFCQDCHEGGRLAEVAGIRPDYFSPNAANLGGTESQALKRVHELNYRYFHSLDARSKLLDCAVCHEMDDFCSTCHNPDPDNDANRLKPFWHGGAEWGIGGGVGSGGGLHAEMAKRDIEQCAACHDIEGDDPTCLKCHMDSRAGTGNDPKTHEISFMNDFKGGWHDDPNYICFSCHIGALPSGVGFCGYCHGPIGG